MQCISSPPTTLNYSFIYKWNAQNSAAILIQTHFRRQKRSFFCSTEVAIAEPIKFEYIHLLSVRYNDIYLCLPNKPLSSASVEHYSLTTFLFSIIYRTVRCTDISFGKFWFELTKVGKDCCVGKVKLYIRGQYEILMSTSEASLIINLQKGRRAMDISRTPKLNEQMHNDFLLGKSFKYEHAGIKLFCGIFSYLFTIFTKMPLFELEKIYKTASFGKQTNRFPCKRNDKPQVFEINKSLDFSHSLCILVCVMYKLISFRLTAVSYCEDL
ncbi:hypothetical protein EGR_01814 [Echinococcus granulosus]|uniref:Uncharacterized protein n=1 Tax=Echinococcus granulosus TaxID=6210 RepID=W6UQ09_ECHGR|nr:hypothetical protein EGR_01814 [Echinococcus granulosus]EUB63323.1 hypothetical protein EGR_01814 [Echinococcus granulosus]